MGGSLKIGPEKIPPAVGLKMNSLHLAQIPHQRRPGDFDLVFV
jgi:hypothetical protein